MIDRAERDAAAGDGLKRGDVDILKLLFLIRYVDGMAGNLKNLCTLMISDVHDDKITMRRDIQQALDRLVHENYVSRNGEIYLFLTDEEQEINNDIRRTLVDPTEIIGKIGETVFGDLYPGKKYRYKNRYDFTYDQMVDNGIRGQQIGGIRLRIVTAESDLAGERRQQPAPAIPREQRAIVLLDGNGYYNENRRGAAHRGNTSRAATSASSPGHPQDHSGAAERGARSAREPPRRCSADHRQGRVLHRGRADEHPRAERQGRAGSGDGLPDRGRLQQAELCDRVCAGR